MIEIKKVLNFIDNKKLKNLQSKKKSIYATKNDHKKSLKNNKFIVIKKNLQKKMYLQCTLMIIFLWWLFYSPITAYKSFDSNLQSKSFKFQFKIGKTYHHKGNIKCCESGFHCCLNPKNCDIFYPLIYETRHAKVSIIAGKIDYYEFLKSGDKLCVENITLAKEISNKEWEMLKKSNLFAIQVLLEEFKVFSRSLFDLIHGYLKYNLVKFLPCY